MPPLSFDTKSTETFVCEDPVVASYSTIQGEAGVEVVPRFQMADLNAQRILERIIGPLPFLEAFDLQPLFHPLRDYQQEAVAQLLRAQQEGRDRGLIVFPTGGGKTVTFSDFIAETVSQYFIQQNTHAAMRANASSTSLLGSMDRFLQKWFRPGKVLIVAHQEEIVSQNAKAVANRVGEAQVGIVTGNQSAAERAAALSRPVISISIQTLMNLEIPPGVGLVVIDEAHHYVRGNQWFEPLQRLGFFDGEGKIQYNYPRMLVGVTATPDRHSGAPLNQTFGIDGLIAEVDISTLIGKKHLLTPIGIEVRLQGSTGHESPAEALKQATAAQKAQVIAEGFYERLHHGDQFQKTAVFVASKEEVLDVVRILNEAGIRAVGLSEDTPADERRFIKANVHHYDAFVNVRILTEGVDIPELEAVILATSTESRAQTVQMVGRALRVDPQHPERSEALIVDLGGNLRRHRIGIDIQETYALAEAQLSRQSVEPSDRSQSPKSEPVEGITGYEIHELGALVDLREQSNFKRALARFFISPEQIQTAAFKAGVPSDVYFDYATGNRFPNTRAELLQLAEAVGDTSEELLKAWAWDKVVEMERTNPIPSEVKPAAQDLVRHARWALWRHHGGAMSSMVGRSNPFRDFILRGTLFEKSHGKLTLSDFYELIHSLVVGADTSLEAMIAEKIEATVFEQRAWPRVALSAQDRLLLEARRGVARRFGGALPTGNIGIEGVSVQCLNSSIYRWLSGEEVQFGGVSTPEAFYGQVRSLLRGLGVEMNYVEVLIEAAVFEQQRPSPWPQEVHTAQDRLLLEARRGVARRFGGVFPNHTGIEGVPSQIPKASLNRWLRGEGIQFSKVSTPEAFYGQVRSLLRGLGVEMNYVEVLIEAAVFEQRAWPRVVLSAQDRLLLEVRKKVARRFGGALPGNTGINGVPRQKPDAPLSRWLGGAEIKFSIGFLPLDLYSQIYALLTGLGTEAGEAEALVKAVHPQFVLKVSTQESAKVGSSEAKVPARSSRRGQGGYADLRLLHLPFLPVIGSVQVGMKGADLFLRTAEFVNESPALRSSLSFLLADMGAKYFNAKPLDIGHAFSFLATHTAVNAATRPAFEASAQRFFPTSPALKSFMGKNFPLLITMGVMDAVQSGQVYPAQYLKMLPLMGLGHMAADAVKSGVGCFVKSGSLLGSLWSRALPWVHPLINFTAFIFLSDQLQRYEQQAALESRLDEVAHELRGMGPSLNPKSDAARIFAQYVEERLGFSALGTEYFELMQDLQKAAENVEASAPAPMEAVWELMGESTALGFDLLSHRAQGEQKEKLRTLYLEAAVVGFQKRIQNLLDQAAQHSEQEGKIYSLLLKHRLEAALDQVSRSAILRYGIEERDENERNQLAAMLQLALGQKEQSRQVERAQWLQTYEASLSQETIDVLTRWRPDCGRHVCNQDPILLRESYFDTFDNWDAVERAMREDMSGVDWTEESIASTLQENSSWPLQQLPEKLHFLNDLPLEAAMLFMKQRSI